MPPAFVADRLRSLLKARQVREAKLPVPLRNRDPSLMAKLAYNTFC